MHSIPGSWQGRALNGFVSGWAVALAACTAGAAGGEAFLAGADLSHLKFFEDRGVVYREGGEAKDALVILKSRGLNCVRLRLFTSSAAQAFADPYNAINNLEYAVPLAQRAKRAGLRLLLDFHYSDSWADPGKQTKPAAWQSLAFDALEAQVREYSRDCVAVFKAAGAMPDAVQVGNEIIGGMLWPEGRVGGAYDTPVQWARLGRLLRAAIGGIRDAAGGSGPVVALHIDRGGDWGATQWFFDHVAQEQVEFDAIGQSYYPWWHGSVAALRECLTRTASRYGKPVMLLETAFPWSGPDPAGGIPATPEGQVAFLVELARTLKGLPGDKGMGLFWWGAEYQAVPGLSLAGFNRRSFFNAEGDVLPVAGAVGQLVAPVRLEAALAGDSVTLLWPLSGAGMALTTSGDLGMDGGWSRVPDPVGHHGGMFTITRPLEADQSRFYRLEADR